jgi:recombination protein RecA
MATRRPPRTAQTPQLDLSKLAQAIRKKYGQASLHIPGKEAGFMLSDISKWIPCGSKLSSILGHETYGLPCGYYVELSGGESAGKSTLAYYLIGEAQKAGCLAILADIEHSYDKEWAAKQGVDNNALIRLVSAYREAGEFVIEDVDMQFEKWEYVIKEGKKCGAPIFLVVDSLAAMLPRQLLEGEYGHETMAPLARALAKNMPKFQTVMMETNTCTLFINQLRDKIGVMFGEKEFTPGGRAKNFYFMSRSHVTGFGKLKPPKSEKIVGIKSRIRNKKNKLSPPFLDLEFEIRFATGIKL